MPGNDKFFSVNIREYLALGNDEEAGEPALVELLSGFSSPKNKDVLSDGFFIRIFYEKPFNQGLFQKKMRIKFFQVYNEVSKI